MFTHLHLNLVSGGHPRPPDGEWMTISARCPPAPSAPAPASPPDKCLVSVVPVQPVQPLLQSVRAYLESQPVTSAGPPPPLSPPACDADIAPSTAREDVKGAELPSRLRRGHNDVNNNRDMPSQAELLQRQPLLARNKPDPPATDDSSQDGDRSPQRHADFVVEIPGGAAGGVGRDERYPRELWKTVASFAFLFGCVCINMMSLSLVHERLPDRNTTRPLPDIVLDNVVARDWGLDVSEYLIMTSTTTAALVVVFHRHRFIVARRLFFIAGLLYLYRSVTMFVTVLPVSSATYFCSPKSEGATPLLVLRRTFYLISGFGLSINGKHTYCGDYIYSGHTMVLVLSYLVVAEYSPRRLWPLHWALWANAALGVTFVLLAHGHYTVDVIIAYYVTTRLFWNAHAVLASGASGGGGGARRGWLQREWWSAPLLYLERNVRGPVPRRYGWPLPPPLPLPRAWRKGRPS